MRYNRAKAITDVLNVAAEEYSRTKHEAAVAQTSFEVERERFKGARRFARKILSDTGDIEQFQFYEPLFKEQELLVWKRSQRQFTATRTQTIYSQGNAIGQGNNGLGGSTL